MTTPTLTSFAAPRGDSTSLGGECRGSKPTCVGLDGTSAQPTLAAGGPAGGRMSPSDARKVSGPWMRRLVISVGTLLSVHYFSKTF